jgi:methyl-accepting chemotaxis protein
MATVNSTVQAISQIIEGVNDVSRKIQSLVGYTRQQVETNRIVDENARTLKQHAEDIKTASGEQKDAISEIVKSLTNINELAQSNSSGMVEMAMDSRGLGEMVSDLNRKIDNYRE